MQSKKIAASKNPRAKVSAKPCSMIKGVKAKTGKMMTAKNVTVKNTAVKSKTPKVLFVGAHIRVINATKKPAKVAAKAKPAARPATRTVKRKK